MIYLHIPKLISKTDRQGDNQNLIDLKNKRVLTVDGYCGSAMEAIIKWLSQFFSINFVFTLFLTHPHYDHYKGIREMINKTKNGKYVFNIDVLYCQNPSILKKGLRNNKGSDYVRADIATLEKIIAEAKSRGIKVVYPKNAQKFTIGNIKFTVYFEQPSYVANDDTSGDSYLNDGSLCLYFPELRYFTGGDGPEKIYDMCKKYGLVVVFFHIPHHGNNCPQSQARGMKSLGALYCWDNDPHDYITDFLLYGRRRCIEAGLKYIDCRTDINVLFYNKRAYIYHNGIRKYSYSVTYSGASTLKKVTVDVVENTFLGKYGKGDDRVTKLILSGYTPSVVQGKVNSVIDLAKKIISGKANELGKNQTRINNIDELLGKGYGKLVQDEINSLLNAKAKRW